MYQVYKITNLLNNMVYIGSSVEVERRWRQHKQASINENDHHYNYPLMKAFREFGINNFKFEIIETCNDYKEMIETEHSWIIKEDCVEPKGYNQTDNTESPMFDPEIAKKMSDTKREKYGKRVCEIDNNKQILTIWNSLAEAGEETGLDRYKISNVCNGTRLTTGNRYFRFLDENNEIIEPDARVNQVQINRITKSSKKVIKMSEENEELQIYDSIALAAVDNACDASGISKVCNGLRNKCGGFKWKYLTK
jgi:group I intron endonuclease